MARKSRKGQQNNSANMSPVYVAGLYARISKINDGESTSIMNQIEYMRDFLERNEDITMHEIYVDAGISSFNKYRPAFTKMIDDIKSKTINCIIVNDISRFSRDYIAASEYLEMIFPQLQVRFISIFDEYDSLRGNDHLFSMMLKTLLVYSYSKELSVKIQKHYELQQLSGDFTPAQLPYGYKKMQSNGVVEWVVDAETGIVVMQIFEMAQQGVSGYSIAKELNSQDIPSPSGTHWTPVSIGRILTNRAYLGELVTRKTKNSLLNNQKAIPLPESEWLYHREHHAPIVNEELFDFVQRGLTVKEKQFRNSATTEDFFQGKLYCGLCGRKFKQKKSTDGVIYYICPMKDEVGSACNSKSRRITKLKDIVFSAIKEKIQAMQEQNEAAVRHENSLYAKNKEDRDCKLLAELKTESAFQKQLLVSLLEEQAFTEKPKTDDLRGLYRHMKNMREYVNARIDTIEKERFERKANCSLRATRMSVYSEFEQESELTPDMLDTMVERISVCRTGCR